MLQPDALIIELQKGNDKAFSRIYSLYSEAIHGIKKVHRCSKASMYSDLGWAAAILCIGGVFWLLQQNHGLTENVEITTPENTELQKDNQFMEGQLAEANVIINIIRSKTYNSITLPGNQAEAPNAFAKVYYNKTENVAYIDTKGLPTPPTGKVYQVWSLIMEPLTPTSVGLIGTITDEDKGVFKFENIPVPEAFGITLEPEGGSASPTLSQLYTLGVVSP
jgi:hypothetical protein